MRVWDHVDRVFIEVESVWNGRGSLPGDNGAGFVQRPGTELFRDGDPDDEPIGEGLNTGYRVQMRPRGPRLSKADQKALYERILTEAAGLTPWKAARLIGCNPLTVIRARKQAAEKAEAA